MWVAVACLGMCWHYRLSLRNLVHFYTFDQTSRQMAPNFCPQPQSLPEPRDPISNSMLGIFPGGLLSLNLNISKLIVFEPAFSSRLYLDLWCHLSLSQDLTSLFPSCLTHDQALGPVAAASILFPTAIIFFYSSATMSGRCLDSCSVPLTQFF